MKGIIIWILATLAWSMALGFLLLRLRKTNVRQAAMIDDLNNRLAESLKANVALEGVIKTHEKTILDVVDELIVHQKLLGAVAASSGLGSSNVYGRGGRNSTYGS